MFETIVVGIHEADTSKQAALEATELARTLGAHVHLVAAVAEETVGGLRSASQPGRDRVQAMLDGLVDERAADTSRVTTHALPGKPAEVILQVADEVSADLIVIGNKGVQRRILGSVPSDIVQQAPCSVLVVKTT